MDKSVIDTMEVLAMLKFSDEEREKLVMELEKINENLKMLSEPDISGALPLIHVLPRENVFRADEMKKDIPLEEILKIAPEANDGYFQVPQTFD